MRKLLLLSIFMPAFVQAQKFSLDLFGGFSNYQGDLQEKKFTTDQSKLAFSLGARYHLTDQLAIRTNFSLAKIAAADNKNKKPVLQQRNLSFESNITEGNILLDYSFYSLEDRKFTPYVFGGIAVFHFNPYAYDSTGNKVFLKPLSTEGEGLAQYPDRKNYNLTQFAIPFGVGVRWKVTDNVVLGYEIGMRKTFTDYLDDVSTTYVDPAILLAAKGPKALEMSYRGGELKNGNPAYPTPGAIRGSAKYKDWYYFSGISVSIGLNGRGEKAFSGSGHGKGRIDCPKKL